MPEIRVASEAGACYGVERALQMVEAAADGHEGAVHTLGPLIHNPRVVSGLAARGVDAVSSPEQAAGDTLLLRTHGTVPEEEARAMIVNGFAEPVAKELPLEYAVEMNNLIKLEMEGAIG